MIEKYRLGNFPKYGKTFTAAFALMIIGVVLWMFLLGALETGVFGSEEEPFEETTEEMLSAEDAIPEEEAVEPLLEDSELVTAPDWSDSGEQRVLTGEDMGEFEDTGEPFWEKFEDNLEWSMEHFASEVVLYFAVGLVFLFTGYSDGTKSFIFIWQAILIVIHAIGMTGYGFCWPADFIMYAVGPLILLTFLVMAVMILRDLGSTGEEK